MVTVLVPAWDNRELHLEVVQVDLLQSWVVGLDPLQGLLHVGGVGRLIEDRLHSLPLDDICKAPTGRKGSA